MDVTDSSYYRGSATLIAKAIREQILESEKLTASAGVAPNKFLAKIASGWKKPNGLFVIRPNEIDSFVKDLAVEELHGVGKVTAEKLYSMNLKNCADLQKLSFTELTQQFGKLGQQLYEQCRGIDHRRVEPNRIRKSLSVERTFWQDINDLETCINIISELYQKMLSRIQESASDRVVKNQYIKIKFSDFKLVSAEITSNGIDLAQYMALFRETYAQQKKPIRLLGLGVHFHSENQVKSFTQQSLF